MVVFWLIFTKMTPLSRKSDSANTGQVQYKTVQGQLMYLQLHICTVLTGRQTGQSWSLQLTKAVQSWSLKLTKAVQSWSLHAADKISAELESAADKSSAELESACS